METIGTFHGTEVDFRSELVEARRLMGLKSTNLDNLTSTVAHLYLSCPEDMIPHYIALIDEISRRQTIITMTEIFGNDYKTA